MIKHDRDIVPTRRQFINIYDCKLYKTTVYIIVFDHLDRCNHRPGYLFSIHSFEIRIDRSRLYKSVYEKVFFLFFDSLFQGRS